MQQLFAIEHPSKKRAGRGSLTTVKEEETLMMMGDRTLQNNVSGSKIILFERRDKSTESKKLYEQSN